MFFINVAFASETATDAFEMSAAAFCVVGGDVGVDVVSNETSLFADIHFIFISLISLFREFIVSIKYLIMYPDNKIKINTNKSIQFPFY